MTWLELTEQVNPAMARRLGRPRTVLDLGCGSGVNGMVARKRGAHATGVEGDSALARRARLVLDEVHEVVPDDAAALERALGARTFDVVLVPSLLERTADPERLVALASRYVAKEGRLMYAVRNASAWPRRLGLGGPELGLGPISGEGGRFFDRGTAEGWASAAGFETLEVTHNPLLLKSLRAVLGEDLYATLKQGESDPSGFRDFSVYELYLDAVLPFEVKATGVAPSLLAYQHVVVARKRPAPGALSLTIGMLTMDEEPSIARMMDAIREHAPDAKILCVDSSVKDQTPVIAERMGARVLRQLPPRGHGPAMELLMYEAAAESDALIYLDCDFTYPASDIPRIRRILESGADVVNAARIRERPAAMPLANYVANKTFVACARLLNGTDVADLHSGMRGYRSSVIRAFAFDGSGDALPIDTLLWPARSGYHVVEIPIEYQERVGASKLRKVAGTVWTFIRLARTLDVGRRGEGTYDAWPSAEGPPR